LAKAAPLIPTVRPGGSPLCSLTFSRAQSLIGSMAALEGLDLDRFIWGEGI